MLPKVSDGYLFGSICVSAGVPAIEKSSKFILANPGQAVKQVHSFRSDAKTMLDFLPTDGHADIVKTVKLIADQIPADKEILRLHFSVCIGKLAFIFHDFGGLIIFSIFTEK